MNPDPTDKVLGKGINKNLTKFLCQELLYDFASNKLDPERSAAVENYLAGCRETQREYDKLKKGLTIAEQMAEMQTSPSLHTALMNFEPQWKKDLSQAFAWFSKWGWKSLPYAVFGVFVALTLMVMKPWEPRKLSEVVLLEQLKSEPDMLPSSELPKGAHAVAVQNPAGNAVEAPGAPTNAPIAGVGTPNSVAVANIPANAQNAPTSNLAANLKSTSPAGAPGGLVANNAASAQSKAAAAAAAESAPSTERGTARGWLTRGELDVNDFQNSWPAIRDKIMSIGGKAAGSVELGWLRKSDEAYFHFSIPESNFGELEVFLGTFGPVRFSKERHPRVMPEKQIRIILTVKDGVTHQGP